MSGGPDVIPTVALVEYHLAIESGSGPMLDSESLVVLITF